MHVTAIIAAAGSGTRAGSATPKQLIDIGGGTLLQHSLAAFHTHPRINEIVVVLPKGTATAFSLGRSQGRVYPELRTAAGGERRQDSVANAFDMVSEGTDVVLIHAAARPFVTPELISRTIDAAAEHGAAIPAVQSRDTVRQVNAAGMHTGTIPRETIYLAQTPQGFRRDVLAQALAAARSSVEATDEAALVERAGYRVHVVEGDAGNMKVTTAEDIEAARSRLAQGRAALPSRVGTG